MELKKKTKEFVENIDSEKNNEIKVYLQALSQNHTITQNLIDNCCTKIQITLNQACKNAFGERSSNINPDNTETKLMKPWFNHECKIMRNRYHYARKMYNKNKSELNKVYLRNTSKLYKQSTKNPIIDIRETK